MITVVNERAGDEKPPERWENERCCFCREPTPFWTQLGRRPGDEVACCEKCAKRAYPPDVPSKRVWVRREMIVNGGPPYPEAPLGHPAADQIAIYPPRSGT